MLSHGLHKVFTMFFMKSLVTEGGSGASAMTAARQTRTFFTRSGRGATPKAAIMPKVVLDERVRMRSWGVPTMATRTSHVTSPGVSVHVQVVSSLWSPAIFV